MKQERASQKHVVLLGVGHTNAHVVRMWAMNPSADTDLTCISDAGAATYSGYLPAVLAGQLPPEAMEIDLVRLCAAAGARLITETVTGLNLERQEILFGDRPSVPYDVLSVGIGSVPEMAAIDSKANVIRIKPMRSFLDRLSAAVEACPPADDTLQVIVVGGGPAGVEVAHCLPGRLPTLTERSFQITLVNRANVLLPESAASTIRRVQQSMESRGHQVRNNASVAAIEGRNVRLSDGTELTADLVVWATSAAAPSLLEQFDLPKDDRGFLLTDQTLRSTSGDPIFAVGDTGTIKDVSLAKAGVYAVRQGPVLWENIRRQLDGRALQHYEPQRSFLKLLNLGDGTAIAEWKGMSFSGRWAMRLKNFIDRRFMDKYQKLADEMSMPDDILCRGCGCKLPATALAAGLGPDRSAPEDATILPNSNHEKVSDQVLVTTDFFSAPFSDAWLNGRVAAIHAASDLFAMGARPFAAESIVVLPEGDETTQQKLLHDLQEGARQQFGRMGATITGGHTITGPRWEVGFTVLGRPMGDRLLQKQGLQSGDHLLLTKPLGSGVLMVALMRAQLRHHEYESMIDAMLLENQRVAELAVELGVIGGTDVTGFGLLGHLQEMLTDQLAATVRYTKVPVLSGVQEAIDRGIASSLLPANRRFLQSVDVSAGLDVSLLLDPQTAGGLLLGVPEEKLQVFEQRMDAMGCPVANIGQVHTRQPGDHMVRVVQH